MIYTGVNFNTLDSEFSGRSFKKDLIKEINNAKTVFETNIKHNDFDFSSFVGLLSGYELVDTDIDCLGYCDFMNKEIAINIKTIDNEDIVPTLLHEMCHPSS